MAGGLSFWQSPPVHGEEPHGPPAHRAEPRAYARTERNTHVCAHGAEPRAHVVAPHAPARAQSGTTRGYPARVGQPLAHGAEPRVTCPPAHREEPRVRMRGNASPWARVRAYTRGPWGKTLGNDRLYTPSDGCPKYFWGSGDGCSAGEEGVIH